MNFDEYRAQTPRMLLRPYRREDFVRFHDLHRRDEVARYLPWGSRDELASWIALQRHLAPKAANTGDQLTLAADHLESGRLVGEFVLRVRSTQHRWGELGYILHPDFAGRGLATEGAGQMLHIAFASLGMHRVTARMYAQNIASARVLTKLGMRREAHLVRNEFVKNEWVDECDFAILVDEWAATSHLHPGPSRGVLPEGSLKLSETDVSGPEDDGCLSSPARHTP